MGAQRATRHRLMLTTQMQPTLTHQDHEWFISMYFQSDVTGAREYPVDQNNFTFPFWEVFPSALSELDLHPTDGSGRGRRVSNDKNVWGDLCSLSSSRDSPCEFHTWGTSSHGCGNLG